jgi:hypothetical protein
MAHLPFSLVIVLFEYLSQRPSRNELHDQEVAAAILKSPEELGHTDNESLLSGWLLLRTEGIECELLVASLGLQQPLTRASRELYQKVRDFAI